MEAYIYLADGFEEIEALTPLDLLRRAGVEVQTVSISGDLIVKGGHGVEVAADILFSDEDATKAKMFILPGGLVGTQNLGKYEPLLQNLKAAAADGKYLAAICAAPTVFGNLGLLEGKSATCYPSMQNELKCGTIKNDNVVIDGNIITSIGVGTAIDFSLTLIELLRGADCAKKIKSDIVYMS